MNWLTFRARGRIINALAVVAIIILLLGDRIMDAMNIAGSVPTSIKILSVLAVLLSVLILARCPYCNKYFGWRGMSNDYCDKCHRHLK